MRKNDPYYERVVGDPVYAKFMNPGWSQDHRGRCERVFRAYLTFYEQEKALTLNLSQLLDRAKEDRAKSHFERGTLEQEWMEFVTWLQTGYIKFHKGATKHLASSTIREFGSIVKQFYKDFGYGLSSKARFPHKIRTDRYGRQANRKLNLRPKDVKALLNVMKNNRDKAMTLVMFQSGMDVSTTFNLTYGDIKREYEAGKIPLVLHVKRQKSNVSYRTCLGRDAVEAIRASLTERTSPRWKCNLCGSTWAVKRLTCPGCKKKGITEHNISEYREELTSASYLFIPQSQNRVMAKANFEQRFRTYGLHTGLITEEELKKADINPARPYAMRSAFSSIMGLKGMDRDFIEYMMGHTVPYRGAYFGMSDDELREFYKKYEQHISVTEIRELEDISKEFKEKFQRQEYLIEGMEKRLKETEQQLKNLSNSLVEGSQDDVVTAQNLLSLMLNDPSLLQKLSKELKKLQ